MPIGVYKHKSNQGFQKGHIPLHFGRPNKLKGTAVFVIKECPVCFKNFSSKPAFKRKYCSRVCLSIYIKSDEWKNYLSEKYKGENGSNWKGGVTEENEIVRHSAEFRKWRNLVFTRDDWTCQKCKKRGRLDLHPHHIFNFSTYVELRFARDNGITFCVDCHKEFHKLFGSKDNNREQIEYFKNGSYKKFF